MRVLMICPSYQPQAVPCGVGDYSRRLAEEIGRQGEEVTVLSGTDYLGDGAEQPVAVAAEVRRWTAMRALRLAMSSRLRNADVVSVQYTPVLYGANSGFRMLPLLVRATGGPPVVVTFHSLTGPGLGSKLWAWLLLHAARRIVAPNEEVAAMIRRRLPKLARKMTEIPIGPSMPVSVLSPDRRQQLRHELGARSPDSALIGYFGLLYPGKGIETLLEALPLLLQRRPNLRLAVVGGWIGSDEYPRRLHRLATELGVHDAVTWAGSKPLEYVSEMLQACDLIANIFDHGVSFRRSTLVTQLAHGAAIVATLSPDASERLIDGENVAVVPARDPHAVSARILDLLDDSDELERLRAGAAALGGEFTWAAIATATRALFGSLSR